MPSSEIQVKSVTCWSPPPESKSASSPIESPSVTAANSSDTNPARAAVALGAARQQRGQDAAGERQEDQHAQHQRLTTRK